MNLFRKLSILFSLGMLVAFSNLSAVSLGTGDKTYKKYGVDWQSVYYEGDGESFTAIMPNAAEVDVAGNCFLFDHGGSEEDLIECSIIVPIDRYVPFDSLQECIETYKEVHGPDVEIVPFETNKKHVLYAIHMYNLSDKQPFIARLYFTDKNVYHLTFFGKNKQAAEEFFERIQFKR